MVQGPHLGVDFPPPSSMASPRLTNMDTKETEEELQKKLLSTEEKLLSTEKENSTLKKKLREIEDSQRFPQKIRQFGRSLAGLVFFGPALKDSLTALQNSVFNEDRKIEAIARSAANVLAALTERATRIWTLGLAISLIPLILLAWQNCLIARQVSEQTSDNSIVRRKQLLSVIYDSECSLFGLICESKASPRAKADAVIAFADFERRRNVAPDLSGADLRGLDFSGANLSRMLATKARIDGANFTCTNLQESIFDRTTLNNANFTYTDLSHARIESTEAIWASFHGANLQHVRFARSNLTDSSMQNADLRNAHMISTSVKKVDFQGANVWNAEFSAGIPGKTDYDIHDLSPGQLNDAHGSESTKLPRGFPRPKWSTTLFQSDSDVYCEQLRLSGHVAR